MKLEIKNTANIILSETDMAKLWISRKTLMQFIKERPHCKVRKKLLLELHK